MVVWCAGCRRHEVWTARDLGASKRLEVVLARALLTQVTNAAGRGRGRPSHCRTEPPEDLNDLLRHRGSSDRGSTVPV
jgi:hypothetical protein